MFNSEKPSLEELPTSAQLIKSTILAAFAAIVILVVAILPAEYGVDPTGAGRVLGLTEMGTIKKELHNEADKDRLKHGRSGQSSNLFGNIIALFISPAFAQTSDTWKDKVTFMLKPGQTYELKMTMKKGNVAEFKMVVQGGRVNFDLHAHGGGKSTSYEKGRGSTGSAGKLIAKFDGNHGWFWRNRDNTPLTVTLQLRGDYSKVMQGK